MKKSKIVWLLALLVWVAAEAQAQEPARMKGDEQRRPTPNEMAEHRTERMARELDLTPEQRAAVERIHRTQAERTAEYHRAQKADREQIRQLLTPEQQAKWQKMQAEKFDRGDRPHPMPPHGACGDSMKPCHKPDGAPCDKPCGENPGKRHGKPHGERGAHRPQ